MSDTKLSLILETGETQEMRITITRQEFKRILLAYENEVKERHEIEGFVDRIFLSANIRLNGIPCIPWWKDKDDPIMFDREAQAGGRFVDSGKGDVPIFNEEGYSNEERPHD
jgi:hypothetical protein